MAARRSRSSKKPARPHKAPTDAGAAPSVVAPPRIIGGTLRGRKLEFSNFQDEGDPVTRPMKERTREAVFNLVGPPPEGCCAIDLFAGTGALGFEAISRGAAQALFLERHFPTADALTRTAAALGVREQVVVQPGNTFAWGRARLRADAPQRDTLPPGPWLVFCSPPYALFVDQQEEMLALLSGIVELAPPQSMVVVESDERFDVALLPRPEAWITREYAPAVVSILRLPDEGQA